MKTNVKSLGGVDGPRGLAKVLCGVDLSVGAQRALEFAGDMAAHIPEGVRAHDVLLQGVAYERLPAFAAENRFEMIVVGRQGLPRLERLLLGSVAERVIRLAKRPVIVVPNRSTKSA